MVRIRLMLVIFLMLDLAACKSGSGVLRAKALIGEANNLLEQQSRVTNEWSGEYGKVFTPQNRAQFPSNRTWLRGQAERLITLLDQSSRLGTEAAEKYEQATGLASNDEERRGMALIASSVRKDVEVSQLLKSQMRLTSDEQINDEKTFNEKFRNLTELIKQKEKESQDQLNEGKRLLRI